jgi:hypothetical protein
VEAEELAVLRLEARVFDSPIYKKNYKELRKKQILPERGAVVS